MKHVCTFFVSLLLTITHATEPTQSSLVMMPEFPEIPDYFGGLMPQAQLPLLDTASPPPASQSTFVIASPSTVNTSYLPTLQPGDAIVGVDGKQVVSLREWYLVLASRIYANAPIPITVWRNNQLVNVICEEPLAHPGLVRWNYQHQGETWYGFPLAIAEHPLAAAWQQALPELTEQEQLLLQFVPRRLALTSLDQIVHQPWFANVMKNYLHIMKDSPAEVLAVACQRRLVNGDGLIRSYRRQPVICKKISGRRFLRYLMKTFQIGL